MDLPERSLYLVGFGWAGVVSLVSWLVPVAGGAPLGSNLIDLAFGVLLVGLIGREVVTDRSTEPTRLSVGLAVLAGVLATVELVRLVS